MKPFIISFLDFFYKGLFLPGEPDDVRLGKRLFVWLNLLIFPFGLIGATLGFLGGSKTMIGIALVSGVLFPVNLLVLSRTKKFAVHLAAFVLGIMLLIMAWGILLGGFAANFSGYWAIFLPLLLVVLVSSPRGIAAWFLVFSIFVVLFTLIDPYVDNPANRPANTAFDNTYTVISVASMIVLTIAYYKRQKNLAMALLDEERDRSEKLLLNILPAKIAESLKEHESTIADYYDSASILFADLVGFTPMTLSMAPTEMVDLLNRIYSHFDALADKYGVEKIRTIGDNYMVASGVPETRPDHAQALAAMALDMLAFAGTLPARNGHALQFRLGINSGPLVAGVIGQKKFHYDVWGDTVNTASRMESHGLPGKIQLTAQTRNLIQGEFICENRGSLEIKGKGEMETWFLVARK